MAYQGEDVKFVINGDDMVNLDNLEDFIVSIYPHCKYDPAKAIKLTKKESNFKPVLDGNNNGTNTYTGTIPSSISKYMIPGKYNMEILGKNTDGEYVIHMEKHALTIEPSVSKNYVECIKKFKKKQPLLFRYKIVLLLMFF